MQKALLIFPVIFLLSASCAKGKEYSVVRDIYINKSEQMPIGYNERGEGIHLMIDDLRPIATGLGNAGNYPIYVYLVKGKSGIIAIDKDFILESGKYKMSLSEGVNGYVSISISKIDSE